MADVRDWGRFIRGRWDWTRFGYEKGFPRGCQFTDADAAVEFDGRRLLIEAKAYDGTGPLKELTRGQRLWLEDEARLGKTVFVLYGCGVCNDPYAVDDLTRRVRHDWRGLDKDERRMRLKQTIDEALGLAG